MTSAGRRTVALGAAGSNEIMAAPTYGAGNVDAVELKPVTELGMYVAAVVLQLFAQGDDDESLEGVRAYPAVRTE